MGGVVADGAGISWVVGAGTATIVRLDRPDAAAPAGTWTVAPGDSFWSIAGAVLGDRLGRVPSEVEHTAYWSTLVDANRSHLVSDDPDLVYPGQVFELP